MSKHTPGPWSSGIAPAAIVVYGDSTMPRTVVARVPNKGYPANATYDARLIKAAPDMLAALKEAADALAYAAYNIDGSKLADLPANIIESTGAAETALIAERTVRAAIAQALAD